MLAPPGPGRRVPAAVATPAATVSQGGAMVWRLPRTNPKTKSVSVTTTAEASQELSALMPMPARSGKTAKVSKDP